MFTNIKLTPYLINIFLSEFSTSIYPVNTEASQSRFHRN